MSRRQQHLQCFDGLAPVCDIKKCIKHGHSVLILMRGPPGCGKSHIAKELLAYRKVDDEDTRQPVILSTDRFFYTPNGRYAFDHTRLEEFHKKNQTEARAAMENNQSPVIIDNTNMQLVHMKPYINFALKSFYEIYIIDPATPWRLDVRQLAKKNTHFVDERDIERMLATFEKVNRFADLLKPAEFVISRIALSDDESDEEGSTAVAQLVQPSSLNILASSIAGGESSRSVSSVTCSPPPGLFSPPIGLQQGQSVQQLQPPRQPSPIFSMSHAQLFSVHQRDVGCQATPAMGLLLEMEEEDKAKVTPPCCFFEGDSRVAQRKRGAVSVDVETDAACPAPGPVAIFAAAFPTAPIEDVEHYAVDFPAADYAALLLDMGYPMDFDAGISWHTEDADRNSRARRGRHKEIVGAFKESAATPTTPKKQTSIRTQKQMKTGRGEGCGVTPEDHHSSSASLSNGYSYEEKMEPLAAAFTDDDELIALDVQQPIKNILELFFGHNSRQPDVHLPMWLLHLVHRCARGDRVTKSGVYHEDFPSIDLCALQDEEVALQERSRTKQEQMRDDAEIARRLHAEETMKHRSRSSSPTDTFTPDQIKSVRMLRGKYPAADPDQVAVLFKEMGFVTSMTMSVLAEQFGEAAPGPAHTLPSAVFPPPPPMPVATFSSSVSRSSSTTTSASAASASLGLQQLHQSYARPLPTQLANGRITDVGRMAAANGASRTQDQIRLDFCALHEKRQEKQQKLDEALKKAQSAIGHARGYYGQEIRRAKEARIQVEQEIAELAQWWNDNLNSDVIDLHWMLADQAMQLLRERIEKIRRGRGPKRLTVITGSGNNSVGGKAEIKQRVISMANSQGFQYHHNNTGAIIINF